MKRKSYEHCPNRKQNLAGFLEGRKDDVFRCLLDSKYSPRHQKFCYGPCEFRGDNFRACPIYKKGGPLLSSRDYMGCSAGAIR